MNIAEAKNHGEDIDRATDPGGGPGAPAGHFRGPRAEALRPGTRHRAGVGTGRRIAVEERARIYLHAGDLASCSRPGPANRAAQGRGREGLMTPPSRRTRG